MTEKAKEEATAVAKDCKKKFEAESAAVGTVSATLKTVEKAASDSKGSKEEKARLTAESEGLKKQVDDAQKDLDDSKKACEEVDGALAKVVDEAAEKIKKLTKAVEEAKEATEAAEKEAKATILTLPGGQEEVEKAAKEDAKENEAEASAAASATAATVTKTKTETVTSTGKPKAPPVPAPKPKEEEKKDEKDEDGKKKKPTPPPTPEPSVAAKKKKLHTVVVEGGEEEDDDIVDVTPIEVPGGEAQITKDVTEGTLAAHNARVALVKTQAEAEHELKQIRESITKYTKNMGTLEEDLTKDKSLRTAKQTELESLKTSIVTAKALGAGGAAGKGAE